MKRYRKEGAVTIFLSLIIVLILAIACSTLEVTRIQMAKAQVERALNTAMTSVLAEYDKDLLETYGVFALDTTYGSETVDPSLITNRLKSYLQYTLEPQENLSRSNIFYQILFPQNQAFIDLFRYEVKDVQLHTVKSLIAEEGEIFKHQIIEYMKYRGPYLLIEGFLEKLELLSKVAATAEVVEEKAEIEEKAAEAGEGFLELMTLIDGLTYKKGQVQVKGNLPKITTPFIKQLDVDATSQTYANHPTVNQAIKEQVYESYEIMEQIPNDLEIVYEARVRYHILEIAIEAIDIKIADEKDKRRPLVRKENDLEDEIKEAEEKKESTSSLKDKLKDIRDEIDEIDDVIDDLEEQKEDLEERQHDEKELSDFHYAQYQNALKDLQNVLLGVYNNHIEALDVINKMSKETENLKTVIEAYEQRLADKQEEMIHETYEALKQDIEDLKIQLGMAEENSLNLNPFGNIPLMKEVLEKNIQLLDDDEIQGLTTLYNGQFYKSLDAEAEKEARYGTIGNVYRETKDTIKAYFSKIKGYQIDGLDFDYSNFNLTKDDQLIDPRDNPALQDTVGMDEEAVPTVFNGKETSFKSDLPSSVLDNISQEANDGSTPNFENRAFALEALDFVKNLGTNLVDGLDAFTKELLINEYILGNFRNATHQLENADMSMIGQGTLDNHYLSYEVEYILEGHLDEEANFQGVKNNIVLVRFALNLIHILADPIKRQETFALAMALIGWSPLAFLVYIAQFLIMCAWSFGEAYIDLKLLLEGKHVAFLKTKGDWVLSLTGISQFAIDKISEEVNQQIQHVTQYTVEKTNEFVDNFSDQMADGVKNYANEQINNLLDEVYRLGNDAVDSIDQQVDKALNELLTKAQKGEDLSVPDAYVGYNEAGDDLMVLIRNEVNHRKNQLINEGIHYLIQVKEEIKNQLNEEINQAKALVIDKVETTIDSSLEKVSEQIKEEMTNGLEEVGTVAKDKVNEISEKLKEQLHNDLEETMNQQIETSEDEGILSQKSSFAFSYEDYLRIFLLLAVDDTEKLYRTMDCIQMNIQEDRENFAMRHQLFEYTASVTVEMAPIFFTLPFMPEGAKDFGEKAYTLRVELSHAY